MFCIHSPLLGIEFPVTMPVKDVSKLRSGNCFRVILCSVRLYFNINAFAMNFFPRIVFVVQNFIGPVNSFYNYDYATYICARANLWIYFFISISVIMMSFFSLSVCNVRSLSSYLGDSPNQFCQISSDCRVNHDVYDTFTDRRRNTDELNWQAHNGPNTLPPLSSA